MVVLLGVVRAATRLDTAKVYRLRGIEHEHQARYADALITAREGLGLLGVSLPQSNDSIATALVAEMQAGKCEKGGVPNTTNFALCPSWQG